MKSFGFDYSVLSIVVFGERHIAVPHSAFVGDADTDIPIFAASYVRPVIGAVSYQVSQRACYIIDSARISALAIASPAQAV